MRVLVLGATGGSGRGAVERLLADGHEVTAFVRGPGELPPHPRLGYHAGDAMSGSDLDRAVQGHDAVVIALGIRENPFRVRLLGAAHTPMNIRSVGTRHAIAAMRKHGVRRLIVQSSYGVGATRARLRLIDAAFFQLVLKPQIADTEAQEREVIASDLDWLIVQPVHLTDGAQDELPFSSTNGETRETSVSRKSVGRFLAHAVASPTLVHTSIALSAA